MKSLILEPQKAERTGSWITRRCAITKLDGTIKVAMQDLWFQFSNEVTLPDDNDCDSYLLAMLMDAMLEDRKIIIKGSISHELLSNLVEYQSIWHKWLPEIYSVVDIVVQQVRSDEIAVTGAVCAFSGGVDATFSVWRHTQKRNSYRSQTINLCSLVHGFDIPLSDVKAFESAQKRSRNTLNDLNLDLEPIKTNYREISVANWEDSHACALIAALSNLKFIAGTCIVGSSHAYNALRIPWGSSPTSDYLLSSDQFKVMHDGSSHNRVEKVHDILDWNIGVNNLRVCWEGELKDRNCGICEKCLRTKYNFLANGHVIPSCFPEIGSKQNNLDNLVLKNAESRVNWLHIYEYAIQNNVKDSWVSQLREVLYKKKSAIEILFPEKSIQRKIFSKIRRFV